MNESAVKRVILRSMADYNGYARRLEDQYAVGIFDMILIPKGLPVFMAEVKIVHDNIFGPTPRQQVELMRIQEVAADGGHVIPVMIGWHDKVFYFHAPQMKIDRRDCFSITTTDVPFHHQLVKYYHAQRGKT